MGDLRARPSQPAKRGAASQAVIDYVREHPGCLSKDLAEALGMETGQVSSRLAWLGELEGRFEENNFHLRWYIRAD